MSIYKSIFVSDDYDELEPGTQIQGVDGSIKVFGETAFASLEDAVAAGVTNAIIRVDSGKYECYVADAAGNISLAEQVVFVNFKGGSNLSYDNGEYSRTVEMAPAAYSAEEQAAIVDALNDKNAAAGIVFTAEEPAAGSVYSAVHVGSTASFDDLGSFKGLSETIDVDNQIKNDEAFVNTNNISSVADVIEVIDHEAGHLTGEAHEVTAGDIKDFASATPTTVYVDATWTAESCGGHTWGVDAFNNLQDAAKAVADGGTVNVAAGTYNGNLYLDKQVGGFTAPKSIKFVGAKDAQGNSLVTYYGKVKIGGSDAEHATEYACFWNKATSFDGFIFDNSNDIASTDHFHVGGCENLSFANCTFTSNCASYKNDTVIFIKNGSDGLMSVVFDDCKFNNGYVTVYNSNSTHKFNGCTFTDAICNSQGGCADFDKCSFSLYIPDGDTEARSFYCTRNSTNGSSFYITDSTMAISVDYETLQTPANAKEIAFLWTRNGGSAPSGNVTANDTTFNLTIRNKPAAGTDACIAGFVNNNKNDNAIVLNMPKFTGDATEASDYYNTLVASENSPVMVIYDKEGNATLVYKDSSGTVHEDPVDKTTLYANDAWKSYAVGKVVDGHVIGFNAFSSIEAVSQEISTAGKDTTVKLESDLVASENVSFAYGTSGDVTFTADKAVTVSQSASGEPGAKKCFDFTVSGSTSRIIVDEKVTFNLYGNSNDFSVYYGTGLDLKGTISGGNNYGALYLYQGEHQVYSTGTIATGRLHNRKDTLTVTGGTRYDGIAVADRTANAQVKVNFLFHASGILNATDTYISVSPDDPLDGRGIYDTNKGTVQDSGTASVFNISDTKVETYQISLSKSTTEFNLDGSVVNVTAGFSSAGTISIDETSKITVGSFSGTNGTISVNMTNADSTKEYTLVHDTDGGTNDYGTVTITGSQYWKTKQVNGDLVAYYEGPVASITTAQGTTYYETLGAAVSAAIAMERSATNRVTIDIIATCGDYTASTGADLDYITFRGNPGGKMGNFTGTTNASMKGTHFENLTFATGKCFLIQAVEIEATDVVISGCTFDGNHTAATPAIQVQRCATTNVDGLQILNNKISNYDNGNISGIVINTSGATSDSNINVSGNTFTNIGFNAVQALSIDGLTLNNNTVTNAQSWAVMNVGNCTNVGIDGNTVTLIQSPKYMSDPSQAFIGNANGVITLGSSNQITTVGGEVLTDPAAIVQLDASLNAYYFNQVVFYTNETTFVQDKITDGPIYASAANINSRVAEGYDVSFLNNATISGLVYYTDVADKKVQLAVENVSGTIKVPAGYDFTLSDVTFTAGSKIYVPYDQGSQGLADWTAANIPAAQAANVAVNGWGCAIGDTKYYTLSDAVTAVTADQTIILLSNISEAEAISTNKTFSIDLNGFSYDSTAKLTNSGTITITDSTVTEGNYFNMEIAGGNVYVLGDQLLKGNFKGNLFFGNSTDAANTAYDVSQINGAAVVRTLNGSVTLEGVQADSQGAYSTFYHTGYANSGFDNVNDKSTTMTVAKEAYIYDHQIYVGDRGFHESAGLSTHTFNVNGTVDYVNSGTIWVRVNGIVNVNETGSVVGCSYIGDKGVVTVDGSVAISSGSTGTSGLAVYEGGLLELKNGGSIALTGVMNKLYVSGVSETVSTQYSKMKLSGTSSFSATGTGFVLTVSDGASIEAKDTATISVAGINIGSGSAIGMTCTNLISFSESFANAGALAVDMTNAQGALYTVVDYTGAGTKTLDDYGTVTLTGTGADAYELSVYENDLVIKLKGSSVIEPETNPSTGYKEVDVPTGSTAGQTYIVPAVEPSDGSTGASVTNETDANVAVQSVAANNDVVITNSGDGNMMVGAPETAPNETTINAGDGVGDVLIENIGDDGSVLVNGKIVAKQVKIVNETKNTLAASGRIEAVDVIVENNKVTATTNEGTINLTKTIAAEGSIDITNGNLQTNESGVIHMGGVTEADKHTAQGGLKIVNEVNNVINGAGDAGSADEKAAIIAVKEAVVITNDGHINANITTDDTVTIYNNSANTIIGEYTGSTVDVTNTAEGAAHNVALTATAGNINLVNDGTMYDVAFTTGELESVNISYSGSAAPATAITGATVNTGMLYLGGESLEMTAGAVDSVYLGSDTWTEVNGGTFTWKEGTVGTVRGAYNGSEITAEQKRGAVVIDNASKDLLSAVTIDNVDKVTLASGSNSFSTSDKADYYMDEVAVAEGATLNWSFTDDDKMTYNIGTTPAKDDGLVKMTGAGTIAFQQAGEYSFGDMDVSGFTGTETVAAGSTITLEGATAYSAAGSTISNAGVVNFEADSATADMAVVNSGTVNVDGATDFTAKVTNSGTVNVKAASTFADAANTGTFQVDADTTFTAMDNDSTVNVNTANVTGTIDNAGTINVTEAATLAGSIANDGTVNVNKAATISANITGGTGAVNVNEDTALTGDVSGYTGTYTAADGKTGSFSGTYASSFNLNGEGTFTFADKAASFDVVSDTNATILNTGNNNATLTQGIYGNVTGTGAVNTKTNAITAADITAGSVTADSGLTASSITATGAVTANAAIIASGDISAASLDANKKVFASGTIAVTGAIDADAEVTADAIEAGTLNANDNVAATKDINAATINAKALVYAGGTVGATATNLSIKDGGYVIAGAISSFGTISVTSDTAAFTTPYTLIDSVAGQTYAATLSFMVTGQAAKEISIDGAAVKIGDRFVKAYTNDGDLLMANYTFSGSILVNSDWSNVEGTLVYWPTASDQHIIGGDAAKTLDDAITYVSGDADKKAAISIVKGDAKVQTYSLSKALIQDSTKLTNLTLEGDQKGGSQTGTYEAVIKSGNVIARATEGAATTLTLKNLTVKTNVFGGAKVGSTATAGAASNLVVESGLYSGSYVAGGSYVTAGTYTAAASNVTVGGGAKVQVNGRIIGGAVAGSGATVNAADAAVTIDAANTVILRGDIYAAGAKTGTGVVNTAGTNTTVTFTGSAANLTFTGRVSGGVYGQAVGSFAGNSTLVFDNFSGTFKGLIQDMDTITVKGTSAVDFSRKQTLMTNTAFKFDITGRTNDADAMYTVNQWDWVGAKSITVDAVSAATVSGTYTLVDKFASADGFNFTVAGTANYTIGNVVINGDYSYVLSLSNEKLLLTLANLAETQTTAATETTVDPEKTFIVYTDDVNDATITGATAGQIAKITATADTTVVFADDANKAVLDTNAAGVLLYNDSTSNDINWVGNGTEANVSGGLSGNNLDLSGKSLNIDTADITTVTVNDDAAINLAGGSNVSTIDQVNVADGKTLTFNVGDGATAQKTAQEALVISGASGTVVLNNAGTLNAEVSANVITITANSSFESLYGTYGAIGTESVTVLSNTGKVSGATFQGVEVNLANSAQGYYENITVTANELNLAADFTAAGGRTEAKAAYSFASSAEVATYTITLTNAGFGANTALNILSGANYANTVFTVNNETVALGGKFTVGEGEAAVTYELNTHNNNVYIFKGGVPVVDMSTLVVNADYASLPTFSKVTVDSKDYYVGVNAFSKMAEATAAASLTEKTTVIVGGSAFINSACSVGGGQDIVIKGNAGFNWENWMMINRNPAQGDVSKLATVTFDGASIGFNAGKAGGGDCSIHISGAEKNSTKGYGQLDVINGSNVTAEWVIDKNVLNVNTGSTFTARGYLNVAGRPAGETISGEDDTAVLNIDAATVNAKGSSNSSGLAIGTEGKGEVNLTNGAVLNAKRIDATAKSTINISDSTVTVDTTFTNSGTIAMDADSSITAKNVTNSGAVTGSGTLFGTAAADAFTNNSGASFAGSMDMAAGDDTATLSISGTFTGSIDMGAGSDIVNVIDVTAETAVGTYTIATVTNEEVYQINGTAVTLGGGVVLGTNVASLSKNEQNVLSLTVAAFEPDMTSFVVDAAYAEMAKYTKVTVGGKDYYVGINAFGETGPAMTAAAANKDSQVNFTTTPNSQAKVITSGEGVCFNTTGTYNLTGGADAKLNYEVQLNSDKKEDVAAVMNITNAKLAATKVNLYTNSSLTVTDSTLNFDGFEWAQFSYFGVKKNSSLTISGSTVGDRAEKTGVQNFFGPNMQIYGTAKVEKDSILYVGIGQTGDGEGLNVSGNGSFSATNSTVNAAYVNLGNYFSSSYFYGTIPATTESSLVLDNAKLYNTQYAGDQIGSRTAGIIIGDGSTHGGSLTLKNGSIVDLTGAASNQLHDLKVNSNGSVVISGSTLKAAAITNNHDVTVTGTSKLSATGFTGDLLVGAAGTATTLTTDGLVAKGKNLLKLADGSTVTLSGNGFNLDYNDKADYMMIENAAEEKNSWDAQGNLNHIGNTLNITNVTDAANGFQAYALYTNANSTINVTDTARLKTEFLNFYGGSFTMTGGTLAVDQHINVTGSMTVSGVTADISYVDVYSGLSAEYNGGKLNIVDSTFNGADWQMIVGGTGSTSPRNNPKYYEKGTDSSAVITLTNSALTSSQFTNKGEVVMDYQSTITLKASGENAFAGDYQVAGGCITVNMTGATADSYKLVDAAAKSSYGVSGTNYKFAEGKANGYTLVIQDNDLYAVKLQDVTKTIPNDTIVSGDQYGLNGGAAKNVTFTVGTGCTISGNVYGLGGGAAAKDVTLNMGSAAAYIAGITGGAEAENLTIELSYKSGTCNSIWGINGKGYVSGNSTLKVANGTVANSSNGDLMGAGCYNTAAKVVGGDAALIIGEGTTETGIVIGKDGGRQTIMGGGGTIGGTSSITINNGTIWGKAIIGGTSWGGTAANSFVTINGGTVSTASSRAIYGGAYTTNQTIGSTAVNINGGFIKSDIITGNNNTCTAASTAFTMTGGSIDGKDGGATATITVGCGSGTITGDATASITGGSINNAVIDGRKNFTDGLSSLTVGAGAALTNVTVKEFDTLTNSGSIAGSIKTGDGASTLTNNKGAVAAATTMGNGDDKLTMDVDSVLAGAVDMGAGSDICEITGITSLTTNIAGAKVVSGNIENCEKFKVDGVDVVLGQAQQIAGAGTETEDDDVWVQLRNLNGQARVFWAKTENGLNAAENALMQFTESNPQIGDCVASTSANPSTFEKKNNGTLA